MFIYENEMDGECTTHGEEKCALDFLWKPHRKEGMKEGRKEGWEGERGRETAWKA